MLKKLLTIAFDKESHEKIASIQHAFTEFTSAEFAYSSSIVRRALTRGITILVSALVLSAILIGFVIALMTANFFVLPELFPTISRAESLGITALGFVVVILVIALILYGEIRKLNRLISEYLSHWSTKDESHTTH